MSDADSAENATSSQNIVITPVACSLPTTGASKLSGASRIEIAPGSLLQRTYNRTTVEETYFCNYEVDSRYEAEYIRTGLVIVARGNQNEPRAIELPSHRFFLATLFQPQLSSSPERPHPIINAFLLAVSAFARDRGVASPEEFAATR